MFLEKISAESTGEICYTDAIFVFKLDTIVVFHGPILPKPVFPCVGILIIKTNKRP